MKKLLVFTDLDGSVLDHRDYSSDKALPALQALQQRSFPVVFNSSKTAVEIIKLKEQLNNNEPFISENGAVVSTPHGYFSHNYKTTVANRYDTKLFAKSYDEIIFILNKIRETYQFKFQGFNDMSIEVLMAETNLDQKQAYDAKQRQASEPLKWLDTDSALNQFKKFLAREGLFLTSGGRFYHAMSEVNKGMGVKWLTKLYEQLEPDTQWLTVALGDSFNDIQMLESVAYPVFISNSQARQPDVTHIENLQRPQLSGPAGWNDAVLNLINKIT